MDRFSKQRLPPMEYPSRDSCWLERWDSLDNDYTLWKDERGWFVAIYWPGAEDQIIFSTREEAVTFYELTK